MMITNVKSVIESANRRSLLTACVLGLGTAAFHIKRARADSPAPGASDSLSIHQENQFSASPARIYEILLSSKEFAAMTGSAADIGAEAGSAFSMFGGIIIGRNIELVPAQRIVQAWKPNYWPPGVYSLVKFELVAAGGMTKIVLDHTGFPPGTYKGLDEGWPKRYWAPLTKYLAANP
jgi:activator of HSP90 ATPase